MKLIDVAEFYSDHGGGVKTYIEQKLDVCRTLGVDATIIAPGAEDRREQRSNGTVVWVKSPPIPFDRRYHIFSGNRGIFDVLDAEKPEVVEGSSPWIGGRAVARWTGEAVKSFVIHQDPVSVYPQRTLECLLTPHQVDWLFAWFWRYMRGLSDCYDTTVVAATWLAERLSTLGVKRAAAVPFGIDKALFSPQHRDESLRNELLQTCGVTHPDAKLLVTISRHHPEKRIGTMLSAVKRLQKDVPVGLFLIGDGPMRKSVEKKAADLPNVSVAGQIRDRKRIARILASADAMVHCGAAETFGLVIAEALCSGLPLVVPDRGGAFDLAHPAYAELHRVGDPGACANAILRLLNRPHEELRLAAASAGARIRTPKDHFEHLFQHYASLAGHQLGREMNGSTLHERWRSAY